MRIAIVEDDTADYLQIEQLLRCYATDRALTAGVAAPPLGIVRFADAEHFLRSYIPGSFNIVVLDCFLEAERPGAQTGMDLARAIRAAGDGVPLLFMTSSLDFAVEGYEVGAAAYLVKPVAYTKLAAALDRIDLTDFTSHGTIVSVPVDGPATVADLPTDALRACSVEGHYLFLNIDLKLLAQAEQQLRAAGQTPAFVRPAAPEDDQPQASPATGMVRTRMTLRQMADLLADDERFWTCARNQMVNLAHVSSLSDTCFIMDDGSQVAISRRKLPEAADRYAEELFRQMRAADDRGLSWTQGYGAVPAGANVPAPARGFR